MQLHNDATSGFSVSLVNCTFYNNVLLADEEVTPRVGVITADVNEQHSYSDTKVRLEGCTFSGNTPSTLPTLFADNRDAKTAKGLFYSDSSSLSVCTYEGKHSTYTTCIDSKPKPLEEAGDAFLSASSPWLLDVQVPQTLESPRIPLHVGILLFENLLQHVLKVDG